MSTTLDEPLEDCIEYLTEGGNDAGVDGLHVSDVEDGEFEITVFQGKYRVNDLAGQANFPANSVQKAADTVRVLFDPYRPVVLNPKLEPKVQEVRSLIRDGNVPTVRVVLCNNGARWLSDGDTWVEEAKLALSGQAVVEDMNFMRVMVGRVAVQEISRLFDVHGDSLLQRNIRRHLGRANRVNHEIRETLLDPAKADSFYVFNNGITMVCDRLAYNALQKSDYSVQLKNVHNPGCPKRRGPWMCGLRLRHGSDLRVARRLRRCRSRDHQGHQ